MQIRAHFAKVDVPTLPVQTEYDDLNDDTFGWTQIREWHFKKVNITSIGQDEVAWTAVFKYEDMTVD
jgi:hypothetical protein